MCGGVAGIWIGGSETDKVVVDALVRLVDSLHSWLAGSVGFAETDRVLLIPLQRQQSTPSHETTHLLPRIPSSIISVHCSNLYQEDVIDEEALKAWYDESTDIFFKQQVKPFIDWLDAQQSESEEGWEGRAIDMMMDGVLDNKCNTLSSLVIFKYRFNVCPF